MCVAPFAAIALIVLQGSLAPTTPQDDGQWTMPGRNYAATRYSGLNQIMVANAARLRAVWSFSTGVLGGHEGQPLVVGTTMYVVTPFPDVLYAFDLTREGYPLKWKYRPDVNPASVGIACCDAISGRELWKTQIADLGRARRRRWRRSSPARDRRAVGRRVRNPRLGESARPRHGEDPVDRPQHGAGLHDAHTSGNVRWRSEPRCIHLERRFLETGRRARAEPRGWPLALWGDRWSPVSVDLLRRPKGMPAYGGVLSAGAIWKTISYIRAQPVPVTVPTESWK